MASKIASVGGPLVVLCIVSMVSHDSDHHQHLGHVLTYLRILRPVDIWGICSRRSNEYSVASNASNLESIKIDLSYIVTRQTRCLASATRLRAVDMRFDRSAAPESGTPSSRLGQSKRARWLRPTEAARLVVQQLGRTPFSRGSGGCGSHGCFRSARRGITDRHLSPWPLIGPFFSERPIS